MIFDDLFLLPFLAGLLFSFAGAPLGCFMIWRRLSFSGDMIAHASLTGVVLSVALNLPPLAGILIITVVASLFLMTHTSRGILSRDTYLALLSHGTLGLGLFFLSYVPSASSLMSRALLGDILATQAQDLWPLAGLLVLVLFFITRYWRALLSLTIHEDLALVEGLPVKRLNLYFMVLLSLTITIAAQYLGALLVTALLIIPSATARYFSETPLDMILKTCLVSFLALCLGFFLSLTLDTSTAPSLVAANIFIFLLTLIFQHFKKFL